MTSLEQQGISFEAKLHHKPLNASTLSKEQFDQEIQKGFDDFKNNNTYTPEKIRQELHKHHRLTG